VTEQQETNAATSEDPGGVVFGTEVVTQETQEDAITHPVREDAVAHLKDALDQRVEEIRSDRRLDKGEQRQKLTDLWNRISEDFPRLLETYERTLTEQVERAENRLFYVATNRDSVRSAYSDVESRISFLREAGLYQEASEELEKFAVRARRTGDRALQTAVGHVATELGYEGVRDAWLATSKEKTEAWHETSTRRPRGFGIGATQQSATGCG
jgi:hypothetical protein